ncbi:SRPBCC family protein [Mycolicibacterium sp. CH28]|uniref:SRPBCC family protein n=1 Tax=Mycolicibacterium sp. CH28 TaxID=2512237 RepID=UPI0010807BAB|nr:SRPBCC family protein [Mycolicibacterium sp. CH28]TGD87940.1 SRPBCC family protein [Mycolicibacterium sp. CH28]
MWKNVAGAVLAGAGLYGARRFYRNWGTTKDECETPLPGDELVKAPAVQTTEGVWIDAPASAVWPWLVQLGQDRGGLYSYESLENLVGLKLCNADRIHPEWQQLAVGDVIRLVPRGWLGLRDGLALPVAQIVDGQSIVLRVDPARLPWDGVWSFHVMPRWEDRCRLLVRNRSRMQVPGEVLGAELSGPVVSLMTRGMLLGIKRRAEAASRA